MSRDVYLLELDGYTDVSSSETKRYAMGERYSSKPSDSPANTWYDARVRGLATITRKMFSGGDSGAQGAGTSELGYGYSELVNKDGALDAIFKAESTFSFRERPFRAYVVDRDSALSTRTLIQRAVIAQTELSRDVVTVHVKDRLYELDTPHVTTTYAGNNSLPAGVEGTSDLAGKEKPQLYGLVFQIEPKLVNTSKLIYQINNGAILSATIYDAGNDTAFTVGSTYANQAAMEATAPSSGEVRFWMDGGMFRLGSTPAGRITADASAHTSGNSTAAQLIKTLCLARGISTDDIDAADVAALDTANNSVCGVWVDDDRTTREIIDILALSVGAYVGFDEVGVLHMAQFAEASGTADAVIAPWNCADVEKIANGEDVPVTKVRAKYAHYGTTLRGADVATSLSAAERADLGEEWRISEATSTPSPNPYKRTNTIERETALAYKADADDESARLLTLYGQPRGTYLIKDAQLDSTTLRTLGPNSVIELRFGRYGFSVEDGTLLRVIAITKDFSARKADITVWG